MKVSSQHISNVLYSFSILASGFFTAAFASTSIEISSVNGGTEPYCGYPILPDAQDYRNFHSAQVEASQRNIEFFNQLLDQQALTVQDEQLIAQFKKYPPYMIRRSSSQYLCEMLTAGAVVALGSNTPAIEKSLYSADSCVFTSLGSPIGQPQWGDVLITFDSAKMSDTWATPHSGWYYVMTYNLGEDPIHGLDANLMDPASPEERQFTQKFIFTPDQWETYMIDFFMLNYKALPQENQTLLSTKLLDINDRHEFQLAVFEQNLGYYLEVHANKAVPLSSALTIQIPKDVEPAIKEECPSAYEEWKHKIVLEK